ncbi:TolC family protein [Cytophagaceae bacterium YF14B1]|uniref:TolC family protein n=1 Tax=Xanthocytophaga flava TaxID=3048013 RepID=A0AAE3UBD7_9BACT|nr:TolC family protein [Xanthocytophaga flavus]MDJ1486406.1 TolC family protein [Xanthocytophaga flavus]
MITKTTIAFFALALMISTVAKAQSTNLDAYIQEAFKSNENLKQHSIELEKSLYALKEAKTLFLPATTLGANYMLAQGGRAISLPLGDLMNPVYNTLNNLTESQQFKPLSNTSENLNPTNFYDVKLHTSVDLYNKQNNYHKKIKEEQINIHKSNIAVYKRQLVKEVKTAWFHYQQLLQERGIYQSALEMICESLRINEVLLKNGRIHETPVLRSQTERKGIENLLVALEGKIKNAKAYFNFLLNKPLDSEITVDDFSSSIQLSPQELPAFQLSSPNNSDKLDIARSFTRIAGLQYKMDKPGIYPTITTFIDLGVQDFSWKVKKGSPYYVAGINMKWDIFTFGRNKYRAVQSELGIKQTQSQYHVTQQRIELEERESETLCETTFKNYTTTVSQIALAEKYYSDQLKIYKEGRLLYIELLDAQNQLTQIRIRRSVDFMSYQIAKAEFEHRKALYKID